MKLPGWFPQITRPWNPGYHDTYDAVSKEDRQWSFAVDCALVVVVLLVVGLLTGCERVPEAPGGTTERRQAPAPHVATVAEQGYFVVVDPATGCEYWHSNSTGWPLTPRYEAGGENSHGSALTRVKGCR